MRRIPDLDPGLVFMLLIFPAGIVIVSPVLFLLEALHVKSAFNWTLVCYFYLLPAYTYWRHARFERIDSAAAWGIPVLWGCFGTLVLLFTLPSGIVHNAGVAAAWLWAHIAVNIIGYGLGLALLGLGVWVVISVARSIRRQF